MPARDSLIYHALRDARRIGMELGHLLPVFEVDDPKTPASSRISECRKCGRLAVIETEDPDGPLFGAALRVRCDATPGLVPATV